MKDHMTNYRLKCYAYESNGVWQAICTDFDISVEGDSFPEVRESLSTSIDIYFERISELQDDEQIHLLKRRSPWYLRTILFCAHRLSGIRFGFKYQRFNVDSHFPVLS